MKACLLSNGHGTIIEHGVSAIFAVDLITDSNREELRPALETAYQLEDLFGKTRYPIRIRNKIHIPSKAFTKEFTQNLLKKTRNAFKTLKKYIK